MNEEPRAAVAAVPGSTWSLLRNTPLVDLVRGRLTGRLSIAQVIAVAELPAEVGQLVANIARRTRLWRIEQVDVARELAEHFRNGLDAGRTAEQLLKSFGDPRQAARLIRRSKLRSRPLGWRVWRRAMQTIGLALGLLLAAYLLLWARLLTGHPTLSKNYSLEITALARAIPHQDRAWPHYRSALLALPELPKVPVDSLDGNAAVDASADLVPVEPSEERPGSKHWGQVTTWVAENQEAVESVRRGANRAHFGFVYSDSEDQLWLKKVGVRQEGMDFQNNPPLIGLLLPQCQEVRTLARLLQADARAAVERRDGRRFVADIEALLGMSRQVKHDLPFLVEQLVGIAICHLALAEVQETVASSPAVLSDEDLKQLAHWVARAELAEPLAAAFEGERLSCLDCFQRMYTDDGHGNGRITADGLKMLSDLGAPVERIEGPVAAGSAALPELVVGPAMSALMASRQEMTERMQEMFDRITSQIGRSLWQWTRPTFDDVLRDPGQLDRLRFAPLYLLMPAFIHVGRAGERITLERDVTLVALALVALALVALALVALALVALALVALALELYHRRHAAWPQTLAELVPDLLSAVPPDRYTGKPLSYRLTQDGPVVYTVGPDLKDDAGHPADDCEGIRGMVYLPANLAAAGQKTPLGDCILWPRPAPAD